MTRLACLSAVAALFRGAAFAACGLLLVGCAMLPQAKVPQAKAPARLALVIGNGAYENAPALKNPVNDAADMCAALRKSGFKTLCHTNLRSRAEFDASVKDYVDQLGPNTVGLFYYSGHGVQANNANYLIPTQVQPEAMSRDPLRVLYGLDEVFARLRQKPTRFQLVILDACRTDLFSPAPNQASGRGPNTAQRSALIRSLETVSRASNGLAEINGVPPGTMVFYATASKEAAFDGEGRNGPLTKHVLQHIRTPGLEVGAFFKRVTRAVETETVRDYGKRQTPFISGSFTGEFCFALCPGEGDPGNPL